MPAAALAVHQLRYVLAYGGGTAAQLQRTGHSYLHSVVPWVVLALALAAGGFLRSVGQALGGRASLPRQTLGGRASLPRQTMSFGGLWFACAACLVVIFACQELLEGVFATGHAAGLTGVFGYGGWWAIPAACCLGLVLAACLYGTRWVLAEAARRHDRSPGRPPRGLARRPLRVGALIAPAPVAAGWSDRGPPVTHSARAAVD